METNLATRKKKVNLCEMDCQSKAATQRNNSETQIKTCSKGVPSKTRYGLF